MYLCQVNSMPNKNLRSTRQNNNNKSLREALREMCIVVKMLGWVKMFLISSQKYFYSHLYCVNHGKSYDKSLKTDIY